MGVRLYYEVYGSGEPAFFLLPTWSIIHSRHWKMQIPYLARHGRVVTFDGRGNGRSDRPAAGYDEREFAADALAVMDATATGRAVLVSLSRGAQRALLLAAEHSGRVSGAVSIVGSLDDSEDTVVGLARFMQQAADLLPCVRHLVPPRIDDRVAMWPSRHRRSRCHHGHHDRQGMWQPARDHDGSCPASAQARRVCLWL